LQCLRLHPIKPLTGIEGLMLAALIHRVKSATKQRTDRVTVAGSRRLSDLSQLLRR
jgi:GTP:adenosylcobinamide-phosphate guanylyltransferase